MSNILRLTSILEIKADKNWEGILRSKLKLPVKVDKTDGWYLV